LKFRNGDFLRREENRRIRRKLQRKAITNNKLNPHIGTVPGLEPGLHWCEASALTTGPPLLPRSELFGPFSGFVPQTEIREKETPF